ncbi:hypothetical protein F4821DRAFT_264788 [Hypoxylon rubiginosum]|uniref:Uncharacterized protein n=1 Tax=Hypoxylon rubiginosum TaxID=110542 RepID=A0ACC0CMH3_9PEZI|nr:hypothetical protein F4821DRAFT_264788 [Hypoxylon rubiginosum]
MRFVNLSVLFLGLTTSGLTSAAPSTNALEARALWTQMSTDDATFIYGMDSYRRYNNIPRSDTTAEIQRQAFAWVKDTLFPGSDTTNLEKEYKRHHSRAQLPARDETQQAYNVLRLGQAPN